MKLPVVYSIGEANRWAHHACEQVLNHEGNPWSNLGWSPLDLVSGRTLRVSTTCTGIDTPMFSAMMFSKSVEGAVGAGLGFSLTDFRRSSDLKKVR